MVALGKLSKGEITRARILEVAAHAIRRAGHAGVSVNEVMKDAGLTHGGFYAHFHSREEMVANAISFAGTDSTKKMLQSIAVLQKAGMSGFSAFICSYLSPEHMEAVEAGCVVAAVGSEMQRQPTTVRQAGMERVQALIRQVESILPPGIPKVSASEIASTLVGTLQMARVLGTGEGKKLLEQNRVALLKRYEM